MIQQEVERKRLTYKEFGALIHKNEKTIPDIYDRASMSTDLLVIISKALNTDFLNVYYSEEPLKSLRNDEVAYMNKRIETITAELQKVTEESNQLQKELTLTQELVKYLKETVAFAKDKLNYIKQGWRVPTTYKNANQSHYHEAPMCLHWGFYLSLQFGCSTRRMGRCYRV